MDWEMMVFFAFVIVLTSIVMGSVGGIVKRHLRYKERKLELEAGQNSAEKEQMLAVMKAMEERMRVLERIATDRGPDLAHEIEALRLPDGASARPQEGLQ